MKPKYQIPKELTMPDHTQIKMALTNLPSAITVKDLAEYFEETDIPKFSTHLGVAKRFGWVEIVQRSPEPIWRNNLAKKEKNEIPKN